MPDDTSTLALLTTIHIAHNLSDPSSLSEQHTYFSILFIMILAARTIESLGGGKPYANLSADLVDGMDESARALSALYIT